MPLDYDRLITMAFPETVQTYTWRDCILYALGVGLGSDPLAPDELRFVYEQDLQVLPTLATVLGQGDFWSPAAALGIDLERTVHGEHALVIHTPFPPDGTVIARTRIEDVVDKGAGRGAVIKVRRDLFDQASCALRSTEWMSIFCRGAGGFGGAPESRPAKPVPVIPDRPADWSVLRPIPPQGALLYRLSGDLNPLHADPAFAQIAGFARPIYHGLGTFGAACHALLTACAEGMPARLRQIAGRFTAPLYPGETLRTDIWAAGADLLFRCTATERDQIVFDHGMARLTDD